MSKPNLTRSLSLAKKILARSPSHTKVTKSTSTPNYILRYITSDQRIYTGPNININKAVPNITDSGKQGLPVYFDSTGNFYDIYFQEVSADFFQNLKNQKNLTEKQNLLIKKGPKFTDKFPDFPKTDDFTSYNDYEQALREWKLSVETIAGYSIFPIILGRAYSRPHYSKSQDEKSFGFSERTSIERRSSSYIDKKSNVGDNRISTEHSHSSLEKMTIPQESLNGKEEKQEEKKDLEENSKNIEKEETLPEYMDGTSDLIVKTLSWDHQLYPPEPDPTNYQTFREFELSYKRWSRIVLKTVKEVPPHSSQFIDMYGLMTADEKEEKERERKAAENARLFKEEIRKKKKKRKIFDIPFLRWKSKIDRRMLQYSSTCDPNSYETLLYYYFHSEYEQQMAQKYQKKQEKTEIEMRNQKEEEEKMKSDSVMMSFSLSQEDNRMSNLTSLSDMRIEKLEPKVQQSLTHFISTIYDRNQSNFKKYHQFTKPLIGKLHSSFPRNELDDVSRQLWSNNNRKSKSVDHSIFNGWLRNEDLEKVLLDESKGLPDEIDGKTVIFAVPRYNISEKIDLKQLKKDPIYLKKKTNELRQNAKDYINSLIQDPNGFTIESLRKVLCHNMFLDIFTHLLSEYTFHENREKPYSEVFLSPVKLDNYSQLLSLFSDSRSPMIHAKVSQFVSSMLQSNFSKSLLERIVHDQDIQSLYNIAYAMNYFEENPTHVFPPLPEMRQVSLLMFKKEFESLEKSVFLHYYLTIIQKIIQNEGQAFLFVNIVTSIETMVKNLKTSFGMILQSNPSFFKTDIFRAISSPFPMLSTYYLFILIYLLKTDDKVLIDIIQSKDSDILGSLRKLTTEKYKHIRIASQYIWGVFQRFERWWIFIVQKYSNNIEMLLSDLTPPKRPIKMEDEDEDEDENEIQEIPPFIDLLHDFMIFVFQNSKIGQSTTIMIESLFFDLLNHLSKQMKEDPKNLGLFLIGDIVSKMGKAFSRMNLIESQTKETRLAFAITTKKRKLYVKSEHIENIIQMINDTPMNLYSLKSSLVSLLRDVIRTESVFDDMKSKPEIFSKIINLFRYSKDFGLSSQLWMLVYECLLYHSGMFEYLKKSKHLKPIIELISTSSDASITITGLHYLRKIFMMAERESKRISSSKPPTRPLEKDSFRSIQKDLKFFVDYFAKNSLFVRIHMIYMNTSTKNGILFDNVAQFYSTIISLPICSKIVKESVKKDSYRQGILTMHDMIAGNDESNKSKLILRIKSKEEKRLKKSEKKN
ncbi:sca1 complex scaffold protein scaa [Anaeramoeba ignava]|uniref:Sca1 complex scaffold protein scaa n=1 Tax=Anaeramoeba ignava TaxID=1746090 RepID=A0A9Q0LID0_ANAIG|nr:sca1 complex scaffold protein scaa [Anaeramoeba ignava]